MITQLEAEKALDNILNHADAIAESKARKEYLEEFRKSKKAMLFQNAPKGRLDDMESYAYAHPEYQELLDNLRMASEEYERRRWKMVAWQVTIDAWRTQESSRRAGA
jgi:hypothetical protein